MRLDSEGQVTIPADLRAKTRDRGELVIDPIVYAEISLGFDKDVNREDP